MAHVIEDIVRRERGRIVGGLLRWCGNLDTAEEAFQDAVVAALEAWREGVPANPGAWLVTAAKNRARDAIRREAVARKHAVVEDGDERDIDAIADDYLRLIVTCCHPALAAENQIALTLKVVCGFSTDEIARAFLTTEATVSQRILRAKQAIAGEAKRDDRDPSAALGVIYAMFNEGHVARRGELVRLDLQDEALHLARLVCDLAPANPEAFGLFAMIAFAAARVETRVDEEGLPILLDAQDRSRWDIELLHDGLMALQRARTLDGRGSYVLQAEIAAIHAIAPAWDATDWPAIVALYDALMATAPSPVVSLNRAIAIAMRDGPTAGLAAIENLARALADYHLFYATRADLLEKLGKDPRPDLRKALSLATNDGERRWLERRLRGK